MLLQLSIKNFALIENLSINFDEGFNILSGETGAGKSILIDAISYLMGEKFSKDYIRTGEDSNYVEGVFTVESPLLKEALTALEIKFEDIIIMSRETFLSGRSIAKINGKAFLISVVKTVGSALLNIHGQHQNQSLLNSANHLTYLDFFCKNKFQNIKENYTKNYERLNEIENKIRKITGEEGQREKKIDYIKYQIDEITEAKLKIGEDEELESKYGILFNSEKIASALSSSYSMLHENTEKSVSFIDSLAHVIKTLHGIEKYMDKITPTIETLDRLYYEFDEVTSNIGDFNEEVYFDEDEIQRINKRIYSIDLLKKKYGDEIPDVLKYKENLELQYKELIDSEGILEELNKEKIALMKILMEEAEKLHDIRVKAGAEIEISVKKELDYVGMEKSSFKIEIEKMNKLTISGIDKINFMISTNPGEPLKQLEKVVSGGELSRIMLALKTVFIDKDDIPTVIFDEIDTGISGRIAQSVAEKMFLVSISHQVFCVTHLPQIAAMSDIHYLVNKITDDNKTYTNVTRMNQEQKQEEIAKMIGGAEVTKLSYEHAKELIELGNKIKENLKKSKNH